MFRSGEARKVTVVWRRTGHASQTLWLTRRALRPKTAPIGTPAGTCLYFFYVYLYINVKDYSLYTC